MRNKLLMLIISTVLILTACGGTYNTASNPSSYENDTVLWINSDGTDCDYGDFLEGDKDCDKKKKKVYHKVKATKKTSKVKSSTISYTKSESKTKSVKKTNVYKSKKSSTKSSKKRK